MKKPLTVISNTKKYVTYLKYIEPVTPNSDQVVEVAKYRSIIQRMISNLIGECETEEIINRRFITPSDLKDMFRDARGWKNYSKLLSNWHIEEFLGWLSSIGFECYVVIGVHKRYKDGIDLDRLERYQGTLKGYRIYKQLNERGQS